MAWRRARTAKACRRMYDDTTRNDTTRRLGGKGGKAGQPASVGRHFKLAALTRQPLPAKGGGMKPRREGSQRRRRGATQKAHELMTDKGE